MTCDSFDGVEPDPEPWRRCLACNWPKAQHGLLGCESVLVLDGHRIKCDVNTPHTGLPHSNDEVDAEWGPG